MSLFENNFKTVMFMYFLHIIQDIQRQTSQNSDNLYASEIKTNYFCKLPDATLTSVMLVVKLALQTKFKMV